MPSAPALRVVFFGTPEIAVPTLERLLASRHEVVAVVSQPDRVRGRGRRTTPSPVAACARAHGIPLYQPERSGGAKDPEMLAALRAAEPDVGVVVAFGQFLAKPVRELPRCGYLVNAHASLLPKYRGAAPIVRAILEGEAETGISVMRVDREMDAGPVAHVVRTPIGPRETGGELTERLGGLAADAIATALERIADGSVEWTEQDAGGVTYAPKIERDDARLDWRESRAALDRRVRGLAPKPGASTRCEGEPLRVLAARPDADFAGAPPAPGTVDRPDPRRVRVAAGDGWLELLEVQRAGGKPMAADAYLRGRDLPAGTVVGDDDAKDAKDADPEKEAR